MIEIPAPYHQPFARLLIVAAAIGGVLARRRQAFVPTRAS